MGAGSPARFNVFFHVFLQGQILLLVSEFLQGWADRRRDGESVVVLLYTRHCDRAFNWVAMEIKGWKWLMTR